jgi:hypothetical protein
MAEGCDWFVRLRKVADDSQHLRVQADVFRGPPAGDHQRVVLLGADLLKSRVQSEVVPRLLAVGLVPLKVVDRRPHRLPGGRAGADHVDRVPYHLQRLERHHHLVVFHVVADQHQDLLGRHLSPRFRAPAFPVWMSRSACSPAPPPRLSGSRLPLPLLHASRSFQLPLAATPGAELEQEPGHGWGLRNSP